MVIVLLGAVGAGIGIATSGGHAAPAPVDAQQHQRAPATSTSTTGPDGTTSTTGAPTTSTMPRPSAWASGGGLEPATPPSATPDTALNAVFANQLGPGWVGGDSTYSTALADGSLAFVFSDTLIGTAHTDGSATFTGMAHSSELVGTLEHLVPDYGGSYGSPSTLIPDTTNAAGIWETAATYTEGHNQLIFVNEFTGPPGILTLSFTGKSGLAEMSAASGLPVFHSVAPIPTDADTQWGSAIVQSGGYLYIYGATLNRPLGHGILGMKIARVPAGHSVDAAQWTYWNGTGFVPGESNATLVGTVNQLCGVVPNPNGKGFVGVSVPAGLLYDKTVDLSYAASPAGPWSTPQPVYAIPELKQYDGEMAYFPTFHPELSSDPDDLVVSYNIDTTVGYSVLEHDIHSYQPRFLLIHG